MFWQESDRAGPATSAHVPGLQGEGPSPEAHRSVPWLQTHLGSESQQVARAGACVLCKAGIKLLKGTQLRKKGGGGKTHSCFSE